MMDVKKLVLPVLLCGSLAACDDDHQHDGEHGHKHEQHETKPASNPVSTEASKEHGHDDHKHERTEHAAHEHGAARLTIVTTDSGLDITLETPAANVFGFEHTAKTDEDKQTVSAAAAKLAAVFAPNSEANCELKDRTVEADGESGGHSDVDASWTFTCADVDKISGVDVTLFSAFPQGFQHVNAEWVTATGVGAKELEQDERLELR